MKTLRFLIVDDDSDSLFLARRNLAATFPGALIDQAICGPDAVLMLGNGDRDYDAIITDYRMPNMDGLTMVKAIREMGIGIPIILRTAMDDLHYAAKDAGVDRLLPWYRWRHLGEVIKEILMERGYDFAKESEGA